MAMHADLTKTFSAEQFDFAIESWRWLDLSAKQAKFTSLFGDVFLVSADGRLWFLDTLEGTLTQPWSNREELVAELDTQAGQDHYLSVGPVLMARRNGLTPGPDQVFTWKIAPVIGGPMQPENTQVFDFTVAVNMAGQLHDQLRDKPAGWRPMSFTIEHEQPTKRGLFGRRR